MTSDSLEIKIIKDKDSRDAHLDAMSLDVARAFLILVDSVTKIIEATPKNENLKIKIDKGSVSVSIIGDQVSSINNNFQSVINRTETDTERVEPWKQMQNLFLSNGLQYSAVLTTNDSTTQIFSALKEAKPVRTKPSKRSAIKTSIEFVNGKLIEVGGKIPNIHVEIGNKEKLTISCTEENALRANSYLYKEITFSAWVRNNNKKKEYELCEAYHPQQIELFKSLKQFINRFETAEDEIESLSLLHDECRYYLDNKDFGNFRKFLRLFIHQNTDVNVLHTILMLTQFFRNNDRLKGMIDKMEKLFNKKAYKQETAV